MSATRWAALDRNDRLVDQARPHALDRIAYWQAPASVADRIEAVLGAPIADILGSLDNWSSRQAAFAACLDDIDWPAPVPVHRWAGFAIAEDGGLILWPRARPRGAAAPLPDCLGCGCAAADCAACAPVDAEPCSEGVCPDCQCGSPPAPLPGQPALALALAPDEALGAVVEAHADDHAREFARDVERAFAMNAAEEAERREFDRTRWLDDDAGGAS